MYNCCNRGHGIIGVAHRQLQTRLFDKKQGRMEVLEMNIRLTLDLNKLIVK